MLYEIQKMCIYVFNLSPNLDELNKEVDSRETRIFTMTERINQLMREFLIQIIKKCFFNFK